MKQKLQKFFILIVSSVFLFASNPAFAQFAKPEDLVPCSGIKCDWCSVFKLLQTVFNTAEVIIFPLIVIYIIYGAVLYIISATSGSEEGLTKARATATDAIIGLVIVLLTFVIVNATIIGIVGNGVTLKQFISVDCSQVNNTLIPL